jgi:Uma2 family endonuclease
MAAQPLSLTPEEFHRLYDGAKPAYEYWYGAAVRKSMPTSLHGILQFLIMKLLDAAGWNTASEVRLKIVPDAEPVPDVIAVQGKIEGRYPTSAPGLCVEILSPGDSLKWAFEKGARYIQWGTECVWIIDPEKRTAWTLLKDSPEPTSVPPDGILKIRETTIALPALFAEVDERFEDPGEPI